MVLDCLICDEKVLSTCGHGHRIQFLSICVTLWAREDKQVNH